jgi:hypothetical protein
VWHAHVKIDRLLFPLMCDLCIIQFNTLLQPVILNNILDSSCYKCRDLIGQLGAGICFPYKPVKILVHHHILYL